MNIKFTNRDEWKQTFTSTGMCHREHKVNGRCVQRLVPSVCAAVQVSDGKCLKDFCFARFVLFQFKFLYLDMDIH